MTGLNIVGAQSHDRLCSMSWKNYLTSEELISAWTPPEGSPYAPYVNTKLLKEIDKVAS